MLGPPLLGRTAVGRGLLAAGSSHWLLGSLHAAAGSSLPAAGKTAAVSSRSLLRLGTRSRCLRWPLPVA